jgi:hypothetical protein
MSRIKHWVLQNYDGLYYREWTGIGPRSTDDIELAAKYRTRRDAMRTDAYCFPLQTYEPKPVRRG